MVSICDQDCLGKIYREGKFVLKVTSQFYGDQLVPIEKAMYELRRATIANLVGETIITECIKSGLVHEKGVIRINGIPHAQIISMRK
ncbi:MAG: DUF424 family protein [Candidatus Helarchaeota archaeon]|nr:DUF424 family protein [Candidatus Helarchaeota archaeon]